MLKRAFLSLGLAGLVLFAASAQEQKSSAPATRTFKLKLAYNGAGKVDQSHKIIVFLFDTPDFVQGNGMPIATQSAAAKDELLTFGGLTASPIYLVAAYDPSGGYDGMSGPPPSGSSLGLYAENGQPKPVKIEPGKTVQIDLPFDDTVKMP